MGEELKIVTFKLEDDEYGLEIDLIQEVRKMKKVVYVPEAPAFVVGLIKLRGEVIPVMDLRKRLGLSTKEREKSTRIIIVKVGDHNLGVIVDSVEEVIGISEQNIDHPDSVLAHVDFLKGVGKAPGRMILIIDINKLLSLKEKKLLGKVSQKVAKTA